jgi:hypothetical protein
VLDTVPAAPGGRAPRSRRAALWLALGVVVIGALALVQVTVTRPRIAVRWQAGLADADRAAVEQRYGLRNGERDRDARSTMTWRYEMSSPSRENIRGLIEDPAVEDTANIDRDGLTVPDTDVQVSLRRLGPMPGLGSLLGSLPFPFSVSEGTFEEPWRLFQPQSLWLVLAGGVVLWAARAPDARRRRNMTVAALLGVAVAAVAAPLDAAIVRKAPGSPRMFSRSNFESYFGGRVRYEKHLSQVVLLKLYESDASSDAPLRAMITMTRAAALWFVATALAIGVAERWSVVVVRYLGLGLLAPSALLYFGWWELAYLSLSVAAFPLLVRGLREGCARLEAGSAIAGLGAALHGAGLVSVAGAGLAALGAAGRLTDRVARTLRVVAWCTAAYLGWIAIYVIVLKLPVLPGVEGITWRTWTTPLIWEGRINPPILSLTGARDLLMSGWVVGAPLLVVAATLWRRYPHEVRTALLYSVPSMLFLLFRWPQDGIGQCIDLVVAGFPAMYALAWVCAHDWTRTKVAALVLVSAHLAFWRILLDAQFEIGRI